MKIGADGKVEFGNFSNAAVGVTYDQMMNQTVTTGGGNSNLNEDRNIAGRRAFADIAQ